jgi:glycosyltransferase involved in cell wall biosynthesis
MNNKIMIVKNILTPYRVHFFDLLNNELKDRNGSLLVVLNSETEKNRVWKYQDYKLDYAMLPKNLSFSINNRYLQFGFGITKVIRHFDPDIIILAGYYYLPVNLWIVIFRKLYKRKLIFWSESNNLSRDNTHCFLRLIRVITRNIVYKNVDGFMSPGINSDEFIRTHSLNQPIMRIPNLIDNNDFLTISNKTTYSIYSNYNELQKYKYVLFTVARLEPEKGIREMILKISNSEFRKDILYIIAGTGSQHDELIRDSKLLNVNLKLVGFLEKEDLIEFHKLSYCFILPSIIDPSPLSVIEAIWLSKPLLLSNFVGNHPEVLHVGENGFLMDIENNSSLELDKLLSLSNEEYTSFCEMSAQIAKRNFDSSKLTKKFVTDLLSLDKV